MAGPRSVPCSVNSVFVFAPNSQIRMCTLNCLGTWHDSTIADYKIYDKLERIYEQGGEKIVVVAAFKIQSRDFRRDFLIKSLQQDPIGDVNGVLANCDATSVGQLS